MARARDEFLAEHRRLTRRYFLQAGTLSVAALSSWPLWAQSPGRNPQLQAAIDKLESFLNKPDDFRDVSRGKPVPHSLPEEKQREVGLTRDTWKLEVISDPEHPTRLRNEMSKAKNTAFDFAALMELAKTRAVRFAKVMTCLNIGCPLGAGIWEGVPLRDVFWLTSPRDDVRRVFYYGFHNDDEKQIFRSSLPVGRVLEDPYDLPPVLLCYKLNGQFLSPERGGPVRMLVPEAYGFKSVKWLSHVVLSTLFHANDTYAGGKNDVDSPLKTFAATLSFPAQAKANEPLPVTGYAQVGISGLSKVQVWLQPADADWPSDDKYFQTAPWRDAEVLAPPAAGKWGGDLPENKIPEGTLGFDAEGRPKTWPLRLLKVHWAALLPGVPAGKYTLRCRTVDEKGIGQPLPRPFRKSGHAAIEAVTLEVS